MITVCSTIPPFAMLSDPQYWNSWLANAEQVQASVDDTVQYFVAIEIDGRGLTPFAPLLERLEQIGGHCWTFSFDDGEKSIHTGNRLVRITTGQNFAAHYSTAMGAQWELFLAADTRVPDDVLPRLLELRHPICGLNIPTYCQDGPRNDKWPQWDVRNQMVSAACILRHRDIFQRIRWRVDLDRGMSDDPSMEADCRELLGVESVVRHDHRAWHYPESIPAIEQRHPAENMRIVR